MSTIMSILQRVESLKPRDAYFEPGVGSSYEIWRKGLLNVIAIERPADLMKGGFYFQADGVVGRVLPDFDMDSGTQTVVVYDPATSRFGEQTMYADSDLTGQRQWESLKFAPASFENGIDFVQGLIHLGAQDEEIKANTADVVAGCRRHLQTLHNLEARKIQLAQARVDEWDRQLQVLEQPHNI